MRSGDPQINRLGSAGCETGHEPWTLSCISFDFPVGIPNHTVAYRLNYPIRKCLRTAMVWLPTSMTSPTCMMTPIVLTLLSVQIGVAQW